MWIAAWQLAGLAALAGGLVALAIWIVIQHRETPEKREYKRRHYVNERGRLADGLITDAGPTAIYYSYQVGGVEYGTSQDVTQLAQFLPPETERLIGPVTLKYSPRNPANSIVVCEEWSGLRRPVRDRVVAWRR